MSESFLQPVLVQWGTIDITSCAP